MTDYSELKRLAEALPAKPWNAAHPNAGGRGWEVVQVIDQVAADITEARAKFIAAANPAAVLALIAENERLQNFEAAYKEFSDKNDWVQETSHWSELGMHRADLLKLRIDQIKAEVEALRKDAARLDRLDMECEAYGTDIHEGNRWVVDGPFATVRDGIDTMTKEQPK